MFNCIIANKMDLSGNGSQEGNYIGPETELRSNVESGRFFGEFHSTPASRVQEDTRRDNPYIHNFQRWDLQSRRLRLISDVMEDYQENMRRAFRLIGCELGISSNIFPSNTRTAANLFPFTTPTPTPLTHEGTEFVTPERFPHSFASRQDVAQNVDDLLDRVSRITTDMYYPGGQSSESEQDDPPYSFIPPTTSQQEVSGEYPSPYTRSEFRGSRKQYTRQPNKK